MSFDEVVARMAVLNVDFAERLAAIAMLVIA